MNAQEIEVQLESKAKEGARFVLTAFEPSSRFGHRESPDEHVHEFWRSLRGEVHLLLCTESEKYKSERDALRQSVTPAVGALTAFLTSKFGLAAGTATAIASAALLVPFKLALQSWCAAEDMRGKLSPEELHALKEIAEK